MRRSVCFFFVRKKPNFLFNCLWNFRRILTMDVSNDQMFEHPNKYIINCVRDKQDLSETNLSRSVILSCHFFWMDAHCFFKLHLTVRLKIVTWEIISSPLANILPPQGRNVLFLALIAILLHCWRNSRIQLLRGQQMKYNKKKSITAIICLPLRGLAQ